MSFRVAGGSIDVPAFREALEDRASGAAVLFEGRVRDHNEGRRVLRLEYEVYAPLAVSEGRAVLAEAAERWPLRQAAAIHREGILELGEVAVLVGVLSAHRAEAFEAARYVIDQLKLRLPIWKKEHYADGEALWVNCRRCADAAHGHEPHRFAT
jgi:molybdopterin synthase catalytic subunit